MNDFFDDLDDLDENVGFPRIYGLWNELVRPLDLGMS